MKLDIEAELKDAQYALANEYEISVIHARTLIEALTRLKRIGDCAVMIKTDPLWAQSMAYAEILRLTGRDNG